MTLGKKEKHTGIVRRELLPVAMQGDHYAFYLDTGKGPKLEIYVEGSGGFPDPALGAFVGQRVCIEGVAGSGRPVLKIEKLSDITVLGPPGRPSHPPKP